MLVVQALKALYLLEALDENGDITSTGNIMASLPLDPVYARTLIAASSNQCSDDMATIGNLDF
jgi:ATP-dependent RNA helicase DHX8/PRP22